MRFDAGHPREESYVLAALIPLAAEHFRQTGGAQTITVRKKSPASFARRVLAAVVRGSQQGENGISISSQRTNERL
jgi:hypothetical protein